MFRLTTPDGFVIEVDNEKDFKSAFAVLSAQGGVRSESAKTVGTSAKGRARHEGHAASPRAGPIIEDVIARLALTDGQRRLLEALVAADGAQSDEQLAHTLQMTRHQMLGTLGAIYSRATEQRVDADQIVHREEYRTADGRRANRYAAGRLLREA